MSSVTIAAEDANPRKAAPEFALTCQRRFREIVGLQRQSGPAEFLGHVV
jgi:hypothetical protein